MANLFTKKYMKVPNISFLNIFREIGRNAFVDWLLILSLNILIAIILIIGGLYLYWQISSGHFISSKLSDKNDEKIFDLKELESVIKRFDTRKENSLQVKRGISIPADPSL